MASYVLMAQLSIYSFANSEVTVVMLISANPVRGMSTVLVKSGQYKEGDVIRIFLQGGSVILIIAER